MTFLLKLLGGTLGPYIAGALAAVLLASCAGAAVQTLRLHHAKADLATARKDRDTARTAAAGWQASFHQSETNRATDQRTARTAVAEAGKACEARVAAARRSAAAIHTLVTKEPKRDPQGCPVRQLVDPGELRDALDPSR